MDNNESEKTNEQQDEVKKEKENNYWRSFGELYNDPEFNKVKDNEFSDEVTKDFDLSAMSTLSRRKFLSLLAASSALAAAGCNSYRDKGEIVPYNKKPEEIILGIANYYASTCTGCGNACGTLVKTREGRPIKIDGNPDHPVNKGKICAKGQASILNLYDPARLKEPVSSPDRSFFSPVGWDYIDEKIISELKNSSSGGKEIAIITHSIISPTQKKLFEEFQLTYPTAKIYSYELFNNSKKISAWNKCYGKTELPVIKLNEANIILALESDFLGTEGHHIEQTKMFSQKRDVMSKEEFNRLYAVEGAFSLTGMSADYRIRLKTDAIEIFVLSLINELLIKKKLSGYANDSKVINIVQKYSLDEFKTNYNINSAALKQLIEDLVKNQGSSIVIAGDKLPESTHIAINLLNEVIGANKLYLSESNNVKLVPLSTNTEIESLINNLNSNKVGVVIHFDTNPVYHFAPDFNYTEAIKKAPVVVTLTEILNESSYVSTHNLPINHNLESWGDYRIRTGFYSLQQPMIAPLYKTRQKEDILFTWMKGTKESYNEKIYHEYIITNWEKNIYPLLNTKVEFKKFWYSVLHDGVAITNEKAENNGQYSTDAFASVTKWMTDSGEFVLLLQESQNIGDGQFANNGWLQEMPHSVTKIVWDNYAAISMQTAADSGIKSNDLVNVTAGNRSITIPAYIQPGLADKVIEIYLGYGRTKTGDVGLNVGINAGLLQTKNFSLSEQFFNDVKLAKASGIYELVSTQEHSAINSPERLKDLQLKREIILEGVYEEYKKDPKFLQKDKPETRLFSISTEHKYEGVKWAMSIDLNKCTGCNACSIACNVENNIPVVGKDQVNKSREMNWIRIDRYFSGTPGDPIGHYQPMLCQHCDNAPCENVCPVAATNHSADGLNQMVYNRCVGTRYCSNNCPYKVRRFNFFDFRDHFNDSYYYNDSVNLMHNPEVTVRSRGVMEKCTFCTQRIMDERQHATEEKREINGENVKTACQDACPADAIVFGDYNNKNSTILKYREHDLGYHVLEEINVKPNVTYIAKLRNVNPEKV